jgi:hypothetical protein
VRVVARLGPRVREASVFAGSRVVLLLPSLASVELALVGARRGSIVISEVFAYQGPPDRGATNYVYGGYLEVYNNADTVAYLDGVLIVVTPPTWHSDSDFRERRPGL